MATNQLFTKIDERTAPQVITNEDHVIGEDTVNVVFLNEVPDAAVNVTVSGFTRTTGTPNALEFVVEAEAISAQLNFNGADAGTNIQVSYSGVGTEIRARDINKLQVRLSDIAFNVLDFGAVGDGVANDTQSVLDALAAMSSGDVLYFPGGNTYAIDAINLGAAGNQNITFMGGPNAVIKKLTSGTFGNSNTEHIFYDASSDGGSDGFQCVNLEFDLSRTSASVGDTVAAFFFARVNNIRFVDCTFFDGIEEGIKLYKCQDCWVVRCTFDNIRNNGVQNHTPGSGEGYTGARADQPTARVWIVDCSFTDIDDGLGGAGDGEGVTFNSSQANLVVEDVYVLGCRMTRCIRGVWAEFNTGSGGCRNAVFSDNIITDSLSHGIGVVGVDGFTVSGNIMEDIGMAASVSSDLVGVLVSGNSVPNPRAANGIVSDNIIRDTRGGSALMMYGILLRNCDGVSVRGNRVSGFVRVDVHVGTTSVVTLPDVVPTSPVVVVSELQAAQAVPDSVFTAVPFDVDRVNTWSVGAAGITAGEFEAHDPTGVNYSNDRFIAPHPGLYTIDVSLTMTSNATGARRVRIRHWDASHSTSEIVGHDMRLADPADETTLHATATMYLGKGEHFQVFCYQSSGANLDILGNVRRTNARFYQSGPATQ